MFWRRNRKIKALEKKLLLHKRALHLAVEGKKDTVFKTCYDEYNDEGKRVFFVGKDVTIKDEREIHVVETEKAVYKNVKSNRSNASND